MSHVHIDTALGWRGRTVLDADGDKIGTLGDIFLDRDSQDPAWGSIRTGLFGRNESLVPLDTLTEDGDDLRTTLAKDEVRDAPQVDPDIALTAEEEEQLYAHYQRDYEQPDDDDDPDPAGDPGDAMTRSEEEISTSEGPMRPKERVRLRKVLVTEHEKRTIPVRREVVELEHDDAPADSDRDREDR